MSFIKNLLFGGVKTSEDPTGLTGNGASNTNDSNKGSEPVVAGNFFPRTLSKFNGHDDEKYLLLLGAKYTTAQEGGSFTVQAGHTLTLQAMMRRVVLH